METKIERRGGRRPGAGRPRGPRYGTPDARSRVAAALSSDEALELFERARRGSAAAAEAVILLLRSAARLGLLPGDRDKATKRDPRGRFWLPRAAAVRDRRAGDLFDDETSTDAERPS